ncbi:hypothetical protein [Deinococcus sonorensis]|uniref:Carboxypeptidase regulatory-like domain-containing protein n=2 Tax=Deinococcus sonorensis TaxID=309891 RepID=A0AAU7U9X2_9DEIO
MNRPLLALLLAATTSGAAALSVSGTVTGSPPPQARVAGFVLDPAGQPGAEVVSVPVQDGRFSLDLPDVAPPGRYLSSLRPDAIAWPGVLEPITVSGEASIADLRLYVYADRNGNGRYDSGEGLQEAVPVVGRATLVLSWASTDARVNAARGFSATLGRGWNGLLVEVGRTVKVAPAGRTVNVTLTVGR